MQTAETMMVVAMSVAAAVCDLRRGRIPNALTLTGIAAGLLCAFAAGWRDLLLRLAAVSVVLVAGMILFSIGVLGGGDGKLAAGIAALQGFRFFAETLLCAVLIGGVVAVVVLARKRRLKQVVVGAVRRVIGGEPFGDALAGGSHIPLAPIFAIAVLVTAGAARAGIHWSDLFGVWL